MPASPTKLSSTSGGKRRTSTNNNDSDSEESACIVWEDETSKVDFRHYLLHDDANADGGGANEHGGELSDDDINDCDGVDDGTHLLLCGTDADRRRRSRRLTIPVAMTQQIEELSSGSSSDDDDDDDEKKDNIDNRVHHGVKEGCNNGGMMSENNNETMTPPPNTRQSTKHPTHLSSTKICGASVAEHGEYHDAMAATTLATAAAAVVAPGSKLKRRKNKRHLMNDMGDIPATISKLRRQHHGIRRVQQPKMSSPLPTAISTSDASATIPQRVIEKENQPPPDKAIEDQQDEYHQKTKSNSFDELQTKQPTKKQIVGECHNDDPTAYENLLSDASALSGPHTLMNGSQHLPPFPTQQRHQQQQQQQHKLSVSSQYDHTILHHELQHLQKPPSTTKSATTITTNSSDNGCRDLFREIELGLDQACGASVDGNATVNGNIDSNVNPGTSTTKIAGIASSSTPKPSATEGMLGVDPGNEDEDEDEEEWNDDDLAAIDLSVAMVSNLNRLSQQPQECLSSDFRPSLSSASSSHHPHEQSSSKTSSSTTADICHAPNPSHHSSSSVSLSAITATTTASTATIPSAHTAASAPTSTHLPQPVSASGMSGVCDMKPKLECNNIDDCGMEDDDLWNEDDLAAIDLSVAMTRSSLNSTCRPTEDEATTTTGNNQSCPNKILQEGVIISEDDDRYFEEMDFNALDDKIVRHNQLRQQQQQMLMTQEHQPTLHFPSPPPPVAPIFNRRRHHPIVATSTLPPSYLSFTRYIVQIVQEDLLTYTKTIGVSLWNNSKDDKKSVGDEMDDLISICMDQGGNDALQKSSCGNAIDGYLHLRGEWYHTVCQPGDIIHLCSLSGNYLTDISALPVVLHSDPPPSSDPHDDLLLVLHPDELISPTLVSEAVQCPRLAVLRSRLGSTGMSSRSAVIGILRHELFERCLRERDASHKSAALFTRQIIRNKADALLGCGVIDQREAFGEVIKTLSQVQLFLRSFTSWNATKSNNCHPLQQKEKIQQSITRFSLAAKHGGSGGEAEANYTPKTMLKGMFASCDALMEIRGLYSTEQWMHVPELGLKGNVDATVMARMKPLSAPNISSNGEMQDLLLPVELKTGHVQNPTHSHLAQLSIYTMMLRARQGSCNSLVQSRSQNLSNGLEIGVDVEALGAASSGMLLYLNHENYCARHVKPTLNDVKTLMGQRNKLASNVIRAYRPRGIAIEYEADDPISNSTFTGHRRDHMRVAVKKGISSPSALPELQPNVNSCERCYKNRECMMYASADINSQNTCSHAPTLSSNSGHKRLLDHFTGHLQGADLEYFCKWDMLIDLERHASSKNVLSSWLYESDKKETKDGKCISSLVLSEFVTEAGDVIMEVDDGGEGDTLIRFVRSNDSSHTTPLSNLNFEVGSHAIISEDCTSFQSQKDRNGQLGAGRHNMHILRGAVVRIGEQVIDIAVPNKDVDRFKRLVKWGDCSTLIRSNADVKKFRLDKDEYVGLLGLLLQNLVNFFTLDIPSFSAESFGTPVKTKSLTADTELADRRRRLNRSIVQLDPPPRFVDLSVESLFTCGGVDVPGCDQNRLRQDFGRLNSDQKEAVLKVIAAEDFALIQGLPGTGKSETISFITRLLVMRGKRVLLTSYTHSAVDNLLCKLMESGVSQPGTSQKNPLNPIIRIGQVSSCHLQVRPILAHAVARETERFYSGGSTTSIEQPSVEYLHKVMIEAKVVGVSALTAPRSPLLAGQHFDVVIVDEAGQISQPAVLGAIMAADSFVLVGDHMQLPPLVISEVAEEGGMII